MMETSEQINWVVSNLYRNSRRKENKTDRITKNISTIRTCKLRKTVIFILDVVNVKWKYFS